VTHIAQLNSDAIELSCTKHTANFGAWNIRAGTNARVYTPCVIVVDAFQPDANVFGRLEQRPRL